MKLVDNLSQNNHDKRISELIKLSDEVYIASPYLYRDLSYILNHWKAYKLKSFTLLTSLKPNSIEQITNVKAMESVKKFFNYYSASSFNLMVNELLHGKVYLFKKMGKFVSGIISSANLTDPGLRRSLEWGIELKESVILNKVYKDVFNNRTNIFVDETTLQEFINEIQEFKSKSKIPKRKISLNLIKNKHNKNYWLKPIGSSDDPIDFKRIFNSNYRLDFSKKRPSGVNIGDILITYAVTHQNILSYYVANSQPFKATNQDIKNEPYRERWPWGINGINQGRKFGKSWVKKNLKLNDLVNEFLSLDSSNYLTFGGGKNLFGLNYGHDKLNLSPKFAQFIINKIVNS